MKKSNPISLNPLLGGSFAKTTLEPISMSIITGGAGNRSASPAPLLGGNMTMNLNQSTALGKSLAHNLTSIVC